MIASEFLVKLQEVRALYDWRLVAGAGVQAERRARPRLSIRAVQRSGPGGRLFDPIGAVCAARTHRIYPAEAWIEAARAIELSLIDAADLVAAANDRTWRQVEGRREPDSYILGLRRRIESAVGFETEP